MEPRTESKAASRRTNSLAFAKNDCHTCKALKRKCDRQRPRCGTCLSSGIQCDGFAMPLVWKGLDVNSSSPSHEGDLESSQQQQHPNRQDAGFKFVQGRPKRRRKQRVDSPYKVLSNKGCFSITTTPSPLGAKPGLSPAFSDPNGDGTFVVADRMTVDNPPEEAVKDSWGVSGAVTEIPDTLDVDWTTPRQHDFSFRAGWEEAGPMLTVCSDLAVLETMEEVDRYNLHDFVLPPTILYQDLAQKYHDVLKMYNNEFCAMPLTHDYNANPFRVRLDRIQESPSLLHAAMALSSQHLAKINRSTSMAAEQHAHQSTALQLFSEALNKPNSEPVLDTLLLLIIFEISQSAHGMWIVHLNGARSLLEQFGASEKIKTDLRMRGQVGMLVWWDVTIALISRREPILPMSYLETLVQFPDSQDWSFLVLAGCPVQFLMAMARLAKLASIYEKTTKMEWTIFNDLPVRLVLENIKNFENVETVNVADLDNLEDNPNTRRNRFHCVEAWRHAVLLFAARAFCQKQDSYRIRKIDHLARVVLDCVRCIPQAEFFQKQLLLPVFLAGSEVESDVDRAFIRHYFQYWNQTSRFEHFGSAGELLEDIWNDWDVSKRDVYWWGMKIKQQSFDRPTNAMVSEALLG